MFTKYFEQLKHACLMFLWLTVLTGAVYPALATGLGVGLFPAQARGSLIVKDGVVVGSALIGQPFASPGYFTGRPSATVWIRSSPAATAPVAIRCVITVRASRQPPTAPARPP